MILLLPIDVSAVFQVFQYDLILEPDLTDTFTTTGHVTMHMQGKGSNKIHLHAKQMIIDEGSVTIEPKVDIVGHEYDLDREFYVIHLKEPLKDGDNYTLEILFTSILNDDLSGTQPQIMFIYDSLLKSILLKSAFLA